MKTNDYGAELDRAGYAPSIMQQARRGHYCYLCGLPAGREKMDRHEPFGAASRQKSKELGLWVELHHWGCHEGPGSVHGGNGAAARQLRADAQTAAMLRYGWSRERWIEEFGKSELSEEECRKLMGDTSSGAAAPHQKKRSDTITAKRIGAEEEETASATSFSAPPESENASRMTTKGKATREDPSASLRCAQDDKRGGGCDFARAREIIHEFWPERTAARSNGFRLIDGPDLPF